MTSFNEVLPMFLPGGSFLKLPHNSTRDSKFADERNDLFFAAGITDFFEDICRMNHTLRVAILDLYEGRPNEGMRCIQQILQEYSQANHMPVVSKIYDVRLKEELPDLSYDIYLSSGGPGSPLETENVSWDMKYMDWLHNLVKHNKIAGEADKKHVLFICHSFQLACRFFKTGKVTKRKSTAFGVFPIHMKTEGKREAVFHGLKDPFYAVDSRDYQVIEEDRADMKLKGAHVLAIEKERPHVPLQRAIMAIRFNEFMLGTQFHPEADAMGMSMYLQRADKKKTVIEGYGEEKWISMIQHLNDPDKIRRTYSQVIPNFLNIARGRH
jgi:GMP synthase-like glutamine amidotransferase